MEVGKIEAFIVCHHCGSHNRVVISEKVKRNCNCGSCKKEIIRFVFIKGFIYLLSNPCMPGLIKIGFTTKDVKERVRDLSASTSIPKPFVLEAYYATERPKQDERNTHEVLKNFRENKEFFKLDVEDAIQYLHGVFQRPPTYRKK